MTAPSALASSRRWATDRASRLRRRSPSEPDRAEAPPKVAGRIGLLLLLILLALSLLAAVPSLRPVLSSIRRIDPVWIAAAIALELASCLSFVALFRLFFDRLPAGDARGLAWTEMASGALLPGGGAGGLAIGGWLIHLIGVPTVWIVRRSGGLFWLTSAVNSASLVLAGLLLGAGMGQPHAFTLTMLPALLAIVATLAVAGIPRILRSRPRAPRWLGAISAGVSDAEQTTFQHPNWRLAGALGYLWFDMAVLWIILKGVGEPISVPALVLAYSIGYLADTLPIPGGIGVLDAGLAGSLLLYGAPAPHVAAAVLVYHAIALWVPGLGGTLAYIRLRSRLTPPRSRPSRSLDVSRRAHLIEGNRHDLPSSRPAPNSPRLGHLSDRRPVDRPPSAGRAPGSARCATWRGSPGSVIPSRPPIWPACTGLVAACCISALALPAPALARAPAPPGHRATMRWEREDADRGLAKLPASG